MTDDDALFAALAEALRSTPAEPVGGASSPAPQVEGYDVVELLHRGGQGVVYRAVRLADGRELALKLLHPSRTGGPLALRRFRREVACAARLSHPNVVAPFDAGVSGELAWCAMEIVAGERLDDWIESHQGRVDDAARVRLFLGLCAGVRHAHEQGVLHRDLKPANVLVQPDGVPRVLDFGLACPVDEARWWGESITATGEFVGTLAYAAPEQLAGDSRAPDPRSDVYSLGVLLYELLTGARPVDVSGKLSQAVRAVTRDPPREPLLLRPDLPASLRTIVLTALAKARADRYQSVAALEDDLQRWSAGQAPRARVALPDEHAGPATVAHTPRHAVVGRALAEPPSARSRHGPALGLWTLLGVALSLALIVLLTDGLVADDGDRDRDRVAADLLSSLVGPVGAMESVASRLAVLQRARERLETSDVSDDPALAVTLDQWLGEASLQLFQTARALGHLQRALTQLGLPAASDLDGQRRRLHLLIAFGEGLLWMGDGDAQVVLAAAARCQQALADAGDSPGAATRALLLARRADALATAGPRRWLADLGAPPGISLPASAAVLPDEAAAVALLEVADGLVSRPSLGDERARGRIAQVRAEIHERAGRRQAALAEARRACAAYVADPTYGGPHAMLAEALRARLLRALGDEPAADEALGALVDRVRALHGTEAGATLEILARHMLRRGDGGGTLLLLRRALQHQLRGTADLAADDRSRATALADALDGGARLAQALEFQVETAPAGSFEISRRAGLAADAWVQLERPERALELVELALRVGCREFGAACPFRRGALERAVRLCATLGDGERGALHAAALAALPTSPEGES